VPEKKLYHFGEIWLMGRLLAFIGNRFFGSWDRRLTTIAFVATLLGSLITIFLVKYPDNVPQYITFRDLFFWLALIIIVIVVISKYVQMQAESERNFQEQVRKTLQSTLDKSLDKSKTEQLIDEKKRHFLNPGISFHYADHTQINIFFDITFKEAIIESLISERTGEISGEIKGSIAKVIEGSIIGKDTNKLVSNIKLPDMSSNEMFYRYQKETIDKSQVVLGIEEVEVEEAELNEFEENIEKLKKQFNFTVDIVILEEQRKKLKAKAAEKTLVKLENINTWVLIEGKFKIERAGGSFRCIYRHPVNDYLIDQAEPITISVLISRDFLEEHSKGNFEQLAGGQPIPLRIYGRVLQPVDRHSNPDLKLTALAIY
jgi:hypothetical protein